ncbi:MAG TPA: MBL fold metallo-hydrolase, partial [Parachlamydiaceae bacterium]|nr:MBL fold metallo-hydrolase [Parachlamydiaceae bacterium]
PSGPFGTNAYIVACPRTREAAIVDPAPDSFKSLTKFIEKNQLKPKVLLLTHSHWDHIGDAAAIKDKYNLPVYIHPLDVKNLETPGTDGLPCWIHIEPVIPTDLIDEDDTIAVGDLKFKVIHTPGHTPGGVCFYCPEEKTLLSGDTLFKGSIGNLSFATARPSLMWPSLAKLNLLSPDTKVYPGHGDSTTLGSEKWLSRAKELFGDPDSDLD